MIPTAQNGGMDTDLTAVKAALAGLSDDELERLTAVTYDIPSLTGILGKQTRVDADGGPGTSRGYCNGSTCLRVVA